MGSLPRTGIGQVRTGINTVTRRRRDGTVTVKYYYRKTGIFLGSDRDKAMQAAAMIHEAELIREAEAIRVAEIIQAARRKAPRRRKAHSLPPLSFGDLCLGYYGTPPFQGLAEKTQVTTRFYIERLRAMYGLLPAAAITRKVVLALRDTNASRPWLASALLGKLRSVLQFGVDLGVLPFNPAARPDLAVPVREVIWSPEQADTMLDTAPPEIRLAFALMLYTAQPPAQALAMTWNQVREIRGRMWLLLNHGDGDDVVTVRAPRELERLLRSEPRRSLMIVPSPSGLAWSYRNFAREWDRVAKEAGISGVQRRDLRRTAVVRMAEEGTGLQEIAALSGYSMMQVGKILQRHLPEPEPAALQHGAPVGAVRLLK